MLACCLYLASQSNTCTLGQPKPTAQRDVRILRTAIRAFYTEYAAWPTGDVRQIVSALTGKNAHNIVFIEEPDSCLNQRGEYLDPWKTPYRIATAGTNIEVRSAGPDRKFGTADDITAS